MGELSDKLIRDYLKKIDEDEFIKITRWEAEFIDSIVYKYSGKLSATQREAAMTIIDKYWDS